MKKYTITNAEAYDKIENLESLTVKIFTEGGEDMQVSDGYHTMDELYNHRITLYIALCKMMSKHADGGDSYVWYSLLHSDGSSMSGWFVLGINDQRTQQITYHIPIERLGEVTSFACESDRAPEYDGHTSDDVLLRLKNL